MSWFGPFNDGAFEEKAPAPSQIIGVEATHLDLRREHPEVWRVLVKAAQGKLQRAAVLGDQPWRSVMFRKRPGKVGYLARAAAALRAMADEACPHCGQTMPRSGEGAVGAVWTVTQRTVLLAQGDTGRRRWRHTLVVTSPEGRSFVWV